MMKKFGFWGHRPVARSGIRPAQRADPRSVQTASRTGRSLLQQPRRSDRTRQRGNCRTFDAGTAFGNQNPGVPRPDFPRQRTERSCVGQRGHRRFREIYPDIPAYLSYENPYFKVTVGNCLTSEEAIILLGKIRDAFDRAFLVREEISLSLFGETASSIPTSNGTSEPAI